MPKTKRKSKEQPKPIRSSKSEKLFQNILKSIQQFLQGKAYKPMSAEELIRRLAMPPQHKEYIDEALDTLVTQGNLEFKNDQYSPKKERTGVITGLLRLHARGFGFVEPLDKSLYEEDIFIPKQFTLNSVDGDTVEVQVNPNISAKGPEGRIITILERGRTHVAGIIREVEKYGDMIAYVPMLGEGKRVVVQKHKKIPLQVGDRIVMEVTDWGTKESDTVCTVARHIGHISDPSCDIPAAIAEYELRDKFPHAAVEEAKAVGTRVAQSAINEREDLRKLECFTIDPDTAKDFDDALTLTKDKKGHYHLGVHIADVSHYVQPGTALDIEAKERCNSTYFPRFCLPMLPSELSDNLCSLKPNVNRLTVSVMMEYDPTGNLVNYRIAKTVIKSAKRFTYREAKEVLDGKQKSPHEATLHLMVELCKLLKRKRYERGSIEFALPELVVMVDENGVPYKTDYIEYDVTHQLVEEFMLKANEMVATHLSQHGKNLTYRVHDIPSEEHMKDFAMLAGAFGFRLSDRPTATELQTLFEEALQTPYGPYLATSYIRRMRLAFYSPDNIGHYGLGLTHYCHFTSPIRRYVDLVSHRILFGESDELEELQRIADHCSERERISAKAEISVNILKKLRLLNDLYQKDPTKQYEAIVTKIKNFGVYFEIMDLMIEGFLHISELDNDYYIYEESAMRLRGAHQGKIFFAGEKITVMLKNVDLILASTEWNLVSGPQPREETPSTRTQERKQERRKDRKKGASKKPVVRKPPPPVRKFFGKSKKKRR